MNLIEAAKQALEALQSAVDHRKRFEVCANLRAAIKEVKKQEPVAITLGDPISDPCGDQQVWLDRIHTHLPLSEGTKLYTHPAPTVPEGWQLVPKEPTDAMLAAYNKVSEWLDSNKGTRYKIQAAYDKALGEPHYKSMLAAAPKFGEKE